MGPKPERSSLPRHSAGRKEVGSQVDYLHQFKKIWGPEVFIKIIRCMYMYMYYYAYEKDNTLKFIHGIFIEVRGCLHEN